MAFLQGLALGIAVGFLAGALVAFLYAQKAIAKVKADASLIAGNIAQSLK